MSRRILRVAFGEATRLPQAVAAARAEGHAVLDVVGPHAVHGLSEALGQRPSRLPWVCLGAGLVGLAGGLWLQVWTSAVSWPVDVGGKPAAQVEAYVPVAFELTVLLAGLLTVAAFFLRERRSRLRLPAGLAARATDDRFVLLLEARGAAYDPEDLGRRLREGYGALEVDEALVEEEGR